MNDPSADLSVLMGPGGVVTGQDRLPRGRLKGGTPPLR